MSILSFIFFFLLHPAGFAILRICNIQASLLATSVSWLIGASLSTILFFFCLTLDLSTNASFFVVLAFVLLFSLLGIWVFGYKEQLSLFIEIIKPKTTEDKTLFLIIAALFCFIVAMNQFWPHTDWDAMTLYDFRARAVMQTGSLNPLLQTIQDIYLISYPWFTSGLFVFAYMTGSWNAMNVFSFLTLSLLLTFFVIISKSGALKTRGYLACSSLLTIPLLFSHTMVAYTNLPFMIFWGLGAILLLSWIETGEEMDGVLGSLLFGLSSWVRASEPFWIIGIVLLILGILIRKKSTAALWLPFILLPKILWKSYVTSTLTRILPRDSVELSVFTGGGESKLSLLTTFFDLEKWSHVMLHTIRFAGPIWGSFTFIALVLFLSRRWKISESIPFLTIGICIGMIVVGTFLFTANPYWDKIIDSFQRLLMFLLPVLVYAAFYQRTKNL